MVKEKTPQETYNFIIDQGIPESLDNTKLDNFYQRISARGYLYSDYRQLAVLEWHLHKNAGKYREYLKTALAYERERFVEAHTKDPSMIYYTPGRYLLTSLLVGDLNYAKEYIAFLDDHHDSKISNGTPGYYILVFLVLGRYKESLEANRLKIKKGYEKKMYEKIRPEYGLFEALVENDTVKFHTNLEQLAKTHKGTGNLFLDYEDRFLCLSGLALSNLAIGLGMKIDFDHPFVPRALLGA